MSNPKLYILIGLFFLSVLEIDAQVPMAKSNRPIKKEYFYHSIDTLKFESPKMKIVYNLERKMGLENKVLDSKDSILRNDFNSFSIMHLYPYNQEPIKVPTIPIDNVIIDDSLGLILCLSRAMVSPYQIILYDFRGNILFKRKILPLELVLDSTSYLSFKNSFPDFYKYAADNQQIYRNDGIYYIDLSYWTELSKDEQKMIISKGWRKLSHYFPSLFREKFGSTPSYEFDKYQNFYSRTDPFYEYKVNQDGTLKSIILNNEYGGKVEIPVIKGIKVKTKE